MGIPMGIPMGMGMGWVWGCGRIPMGLWGFRGDFRMDSKLHTFFDVQSSGDCGEESDASIAHQQANQIQIDVELEKYEAIRTPTTTPLKFWKAANSFPILRQTARFLLAVKTSSATIERLFSSAGIILSKLRRCVKPDKLAALLYIKFAVKYNGHWSLSPSEGANGGRER